MGKLGENNVDTSWFHSQVERVPTDSEKIFLSFWEKYMMRLSEPSGGFIAYKIEYFLENFCFLEATKERSQFATRVFWWLGCNSGLSFLVHNLLKDVRDNPRDTSAEHSNEELASMRWSKENMRVHSVNGGRRKLEAIKEGVLSTDDFEIAEGVMRFVVSTEGRILVSKIVHEIKTTLNCEWHPTWETPVMPEQFDEWIEHLE